MADNSLKQTYSGAILTVSLKRFDYYQESLLTFHFQYVSGWDSSWLKMVLVTKFRHKPQYLTLTINCINCGCSLWFGDIDTKLYYFYYIRLTISMPKSSTYIQIFPHTCTYTLTHSPTHTLTHPQLHFRLWLKYRYYALLQNCTMYNDEECTLCMAIHL